jgi:hypothetical protein
VDTQAQGHPQPHPRHPFTAARSYAASELTLNQELRAAVTELCNDAQLPAGPGVATVYSAFGLTARAEHLAPITSLAPSPMVMTILAAGTVTGSSWARVSSTPRYVPSLS